MADHHTAQWIDWREVPNLPNVWHTVGTGNHATCRNKAEEERPPEPLQHPGKLLEEW